MAQQPTLPDEILWSDPEKAFADDSPPGIFPENQDSNFGYVIRKLFSDEVQLCSDDLLTIATEHFAANADNFMEDWEAEVGLPLNPSNRTLAQRRQDVLSRLQKGRFTRTRRNAIIEAFLSATFGIPISLTPDGVPLDPAGTPLYGETANLTDLYRVIEHIETFSFTIQILNTTTPDEAAMRRELDRIVPAHYSYDIQYVTSFGGGGGGTGSTGTYGVGQYGSAHYGG